MLKRDITSTNILIAAAGGMIGSGWLFSPYIAAQMAGPNALMSWVLAFVFMVFIALPLCELGAMFPIPGGMINYPSFTHGADVGFMYAWTAWLSYVVMTPIEIQAILQYASHFFPWLLQAGSQNFSLSALGYLFGFAIMFFVVILNSYGIRLLTECNKFVSLIKFLVPSFAIISFCYVASSSNSITLSLHNKNDWIGIFTALSAGGVAFAFTGFQNGLILAGEVQNPQRNIPIAILGAVLIGFILYFALQYSFLVAMPEQYVSHGWAALHFPNNAAPLVGLSLLLGLSLVAFLLLLDSSISPFGSTLVFTAATSRILYGMALQNHLPKIFLKLNKYQIPYVTLYANLFVGLLSFLPFPGWQKMVAFLSSCSILSYSIGPVCLLAMRRLQPMHHRPFRLKMHRFTCYSAFYICNLMLYWCGFEIISKLDIALLLGYIIHVVSQKSLIGLKDTKLYWFAFYMAAITTMSYFGTFGGHGLLHFPYDLLLMLPVSILILYLSELVLLDAKSHAATLTEVLGRVNV